MKRILVVDDDLDTINFLQVLLQKQEHEVLTVRDGSEALRLLETQPVNLILTDVAMPGLNGYQLCQRVKSAVDPRLVLTPVILMSGRSLDSDIRLERLARQPNDIVSLVDLVKTTHDLNTDNQEAGQLLRPLLRTLRRKLELHVGQIPCIKNVRGRGYLLIAVKQKFYPRLGPTDLTVAVKPPTPI